MTSIWLTSDFLSASERSSIISLAESAGFTCARLQEEGRHNSEVFLRDEDVRSWVRRGLDRILGLSEVPGFFECYRYYPGAAITPHADAPTRIDSADTTLTLVVYLNGDFEGGTTVFPELCLEVRPQAGSALIFDHNFIHASSTVYSGTKYILRTAVALRT